MTARLSELVVAFCELPSAAKAIFLARVARNETIQCRMAHSFGGPDVESMSRSNEFIHRLCGYITQILGRERWLSDALMMQEIHTEVAPRGDAAIDELTQLLRSEKST